MNALVCAYLLRIRLSRVLTVTGLMCSSRAAVSSIRSRNPLCTRSSSFSRSRISLAVNPALCNDHHPHHVQAGEKSEKNGLHRPFRVYHTALLRKQNVSPCLFTRVFKFLEHVLSKAPAPRPNAFRGHVFFASSSSCSRSVRVCLIIS